MVYIFRIVHFVWVVLIYLPLAMVSLMVVATMALTLTPLIGRSRAYRWTAVAWSHLLVSLLPVKIELQGYWPENPQLAGQGRSYVVVANHQSQFDIPVLLASFKLDLCWVMKQEIMKIPFVGFGAKALGNIPIDRRNGEKARAQISEALAQLNEGVGLMFFPEGTRSRDGRLLPFKTGAFRIAIQQQMPILPVAVIGSRKVNPPGTLWFRPGRVRVVAHPPIETRGLTERDVNQLMRQAYEWIDQQLAQDLSDPGARLAKHA